jgi:hypothetical protein
MDLRVLRDYPNASRVFQSFGSVFYDYLMTQNVVTSFSLESEFDLKCDTSDTLVVKKEKMALRLNQHINQKLNAQLKLESWYMELTPADTLPWAQALIQDIPWARRSPKQRTCHEVNGVRAKVTSVDFLCDFNLDADYQASAYDLPDGKSYRFTVSGTVSLNAWRVSLMRVSAIERIVERTSLKAFTDAMEAKILATNNQALIGRLMALKVNDDGENLLAALVQDEDPPEAMLLEDEGPPEAMLLEDEGPPEAVLTEDGPGEPDTEEA